MFKNQLEGLLDYVTRVKWFLDGKKTIIVSILMVLASVGQVAGQLVLVLNGELSFSEFSNSESLWMLLNGLGLGFLRLGLNKV